MSDIEENRTPYFVKVDREWKVVEATSLKSLICIIAHENGYKFNWFNKAISGFDDNDIDCINFYNVLASPYESIDGIYVLNCHVFGDTE